MAAQGVQSKMKSDFSWHLGFAGFSRRLSSMATLREAMPPAVVFRAGVPPESTRDPRGNHVRYPVC